MNGLKKQAAAVLPYLRRYARALTGSQQQGDQWVRMCVEVLLQQPELLGSKATTAADIFTVFHRLQLPFSLLDPKKPAEATDAPARLKMHLTDIPQRQRQVLLLTVLEGFSIDEVAGILGIRVDDAEADLKQARGELERIASVRVLVIEDEAVIALDVAKIVRNAGHQVVGIAPTERAAIDLAKKHLPHLVLADIQLRDGDSGIAAVHEILKAVSAPVIFVTGFPERLLTGHGLEPAFIITKPFNPEMLKTAMAHALNSVVV
ncbi:MAG: response regulator [Reyranella sp.]|uniref:response regulator n=1 Tax=Reyranella sp. TaxID=1929291 RepID=UPI0012106348|nr:response regulator [Reyranella sp.]TAJ39104.1 MAG: response regulator [Reyranella sp.]